MHTVVKKIVLKQETWDRVTQLAETLGTCREEIIEQLVDAKHREVEEWLSGIERAYGRDARNREEENLRIWSFNVIH